MYFALNSEWEAFEKCMFCLLVSHRVSGTVTLIPAVGVVLCQPPTPPRWSGISRVIHTTKEVQQAATMAPVALDLHNTLVCTYLWSSLWFPPLLPSLLWPPLPSLLPPPPWLPGSVHLSAEPIWPCRWTAHHLKVGHMPHRLEGHKATNLLPKLSSKKF